MDTEADINEDLQIESIKYTMFNKELGVYSAGDQIAIVVKVKCATESEYEKIDSESRAYWAEQGVYSDVTNIISAHEAEYVFRYTVPEGNAGKVENAAFNISVPKHGDEFPKEATTSTAGIKVSSVVWDTDDKKVDSDKEYTVTIYFECQDEYMYADNFEEEAVITVNGKTTQLQKSEKHKFFRYYTETTTHPYDVAQTAHFTITVPKDGEALPTEVTHPLSPGINVKSVIWSPADEKVDATKEYTVTIAFDKKSDYQWADDFEDQAVVSVNGTRTELQKAYSRKSGRRTFLHYYTQAIIQPTMVVSGENGGTGKDDSGDTSGGGDSGSTSDGGSSGSTSGSDSSGSASGSGSSHHPSDSESYSFPFVDITPDKWYYESVKAAHKMGLINGKDATTYAPEDNMTFAEAVKLAVYMNILYNGGDPSKEIAIGKDVWYSTYMNYALDNGIIDEDLTSRADEKITRKEYVYIFSKALPAEAFAVKNDIPSGSIPDVQEEKTAEDQAVYLMYRAGILAGNDAKGTFSPSANIRRAEVAAILIRMMDSATRVNAPAELGK